MYICEKKDMKIKTKEVQRIYNLLNMNFDKVEDFDIAVKLKEIMNVLESKNEIINIALAAIDRKHAKRDKANNIIKEKKIIPQYDGTKIVESFEMVTVHKDEEQFERELNAKMNELQDVDIVPIVIDSKEEALAIFGENSLRLVIEFNGIILKVK